MDEDIKSATDAKRIHNQLFPHQVELEYLFLPVSDK